MHFQLAFSTAAQSQLADLKQFNEKKWKRVTHALALLQTNVRNTGLNTHEYSGMKGPEGAKVFEAYAENNTPAAYRIFFAYYPDKGTLTILAITQHP
ncbi:MAG: hypothetical protein ABJB66_20750 [Gemmatimonadaceae bacterium]